MNDEDAGQVDETSAEVTSIAEELAVEMLANGAKQRQTAEALNVSPKTIQRWNQRPAFRRRVRARQSEIRTEFLGRVQSNGLRSLDIFEEALDSPFAGVQWAAAKQLIDWTIRAGRLLDNESRLAELEQRVQNLSDPSAT